MAMQYIVNIGLHTAPHVIRRIVPLRPFLSSGTQLRHHIAPGGSLVVGRSVVGGLLLTRQLRRRAASSIMGSARTVLERRCK